MLKRLIFFGTETFSAVSLQGLIDDGYEIAAVVTKPDFKKGRSQVLEQPVVKKIALDYAIPVYQPHSMNEITESLRAYDCPYAVLVSYGKIIPQSILDIFSGGIINVHPSLLPMYRGPSPIEAAILNGDRTTGVTIMKLEAAMDAGPIYFQEQIQLTGNETKPQLYEIAAEVGNYLLLKSLPSILRNTISPIEQRHEQATYCSLLKKEDGIINNTAISAVQLEREIRAYHGFPKSRMTIYNNDIIILAADVVSSKDDEALTIECTGSTYLEITELITPSGKKTTGKQFLLGYKK